MTYLMCDKCNTVFNPTKDTNQYALKDKLYVAEERLRIFYDGKEVNDALPAGEQHFHYFGCYLLLQSLEFVRKQAVKQKLMDALNLPEEQCDELLKDIFFKTPA